jgi:hypothetical protein
LANRLLPFGWLVGGVFTDNCFAHIYPLFLGGIERDKEELMLIMIRRGRRTIGKGWHGKVWGAGLGGIGRMDGKYRV